MRAAWDAWKKGFSLAWENLVKLVGLNLLWMFTSLLVITAGPATLALYWWIARALRDEDDGVKTYLAFFTGLRRFFWRGLLWSLGWVLVLLLAWSSLMVWPQFLPPLGLRIAQFAWLYALIYLLAMQPYLLEALTVAERPWGEALKVSAWQVMANPLYSHAHVLIFVLFVALVFNFTTLLSIVLLSLLLAFFAVAAEECPWKHGQPPPNAPSRIEDVL